jgi:UDP-N-acetyl-2-amino-2-deoxyglucuronate dehydrogenase
MRRVRTGLVGCGKVAHIHAEALAALPEGELVAVQDNDGARAAAFAARYGAAAFDDVAAMVAQARLEAVIVCTPHPAHAAPAIAAMEAGAHVLVEKPLASTLADCDRMIAAAVRYNVRLGLVSQRRFFEPIVRMKAAIGAGKIGTPVLGSVVMLSWRDEAYYRSDPWRGKWSTEGGGVLINQSPHHLDMLQWFMGPVEEITGCWGNLNHPYVEVEDTALAMIRFRSGGLASIMVSLCQKPGIYTKIHVHGSSGASVGAQTDGGATFIAGMSPVLEPPVNDLWTIPGEESLLAEFQREDTERFRSIEPTVHYHALQDADFLGAVRDRRAPSATGADGRLVVEMIEAIYRSNYTRRPVRFPVAADPAWRAPGAAD